MIYVNHKLNAIYVHMPKCGGCYIRDLLINHYEFKHALPHKNKSILPDFFENPVHYTNSDGTITTIRKYGLVRYFQTPYYESDTYDNLEDSKQEVARSIVWNMVRTVAIEDKLKNEPPPEETNKPPPDSPKPLHEEFKDHDIYSIYEKLVFNHLKHIRKNEENRKVHLSDEQWSSYYKFTFIRCPYAKLLSAYLYCKKMRFEDCDLEHYKEFNEFVTLREKIGNEAWFHAYITQFDHLVDFSGNLNMNYIGHVETLDNDLLCILRQIGITEIKHWDNIQNDRIINQSNKDKPFYEYYNEESFQFVNHWFARDFHTFQMKRFKTLHMMQKYYKAKRDNSTPIELYKRMNLFSIYLIDKHNETVEKLKKEYDNYIENVKIMNRIEDNDYYFHHGKSIVGDIISDVKIISKSLIQNAITYIEISAFNTPKKRCKYCGYITNNFFANIAHSNMCRDNIQAVSSYIHAILK